MLGIGAEVPANVREFAAKIPKVENSEQSPCWQQEQIAKQQAFLESTIAQKEVTREISKSCAAQKTS